jgi:thiosulfate reductase cytochrome b subunit
MPHVVKKHPLALRWFHGVNFPVLACMVWSGMLILWANDTYATQLWQSGYRVFHSGTDDPAPPKWLKVPDRIVLRPDLRVLYAGDTLPEGYPAPEKTTEIVTGFRLAEGMAWHFALAWLFALNGLAYTIFLAVSGQWRHLLPQKNSLREAFKVVVKDLAFWKRPELAPAGEKYNHAQRLAYSGVLVLGFLMLVTGLAIAKPAQLAWLAVPFGGYQGARLWHYGITVLFVAFFFVHVSQVVRAGWNNFRGMITGWELVAETSGPAPALVVEEEDADDTEEAEEGADGAGSDTNSTDGDGA